MQTIDDVLTPVATYLNGLRGTECRANDTNGDVRWYLFDGLGSVLGEIADPDGNNNPVKCTRKMDVYGAQRASSGTAQSNHRFVGSLGHTSDPSTGLIYMRARYMDPVTGRFVSEDPACNGANWFIYCDDNPVGWYDASGTSKRISIPDFPGWEYRVDKPYNAGPGQFRQDVHLFYRGKDMGSIVKGTGEWKHGGGKVPGDVESWAKEKFCAGIGGDTITASFNADPLMVIAIFLDLAGEFDKAAELDRLNGLL